MIDLNCFDALSAIIKNNCNLSSLKLKSLDLARAKDRKSFQIFCDSLKNVNLKHFKLELDCCETLDIDDSLFLSLSSSKRLKKLIIKGKKLSKELTHSIHLTNMLEHIELINLSIISHTLFAKMLSSSSTSLHYLNCSYCYFHKIELIAEIINQFSFLKTLILDGNGIGLDESSYNFHHIPGCHLEILSLQNCEFGETSSQKFFSEFVALPNVQIETLIFNSNKLHVLGTEKLSSILFNQKKIRHLSLQNSSIARASLKLLANAIVANNYLTEIDLNNNNLGNNSEFWDSFACKRQLVKLCIAQNSLNFSESGKIEEILKQNLKLEYLDISKNIFIQTDIFNLFDIIKENLRTFTMVIKENPLNYHGFKLMNYLSSFPFNVNIVCL